MALVGGADKDGVQASAGVKMKDIDQWIAYTRCLRGHGLDVQNPLPDHDPNKPLLVDSAGTPLPEEPNPAYDACKDVQPQETGTPTPLTPTLLRQAKAFALCVRAAGFTNYRNPDPTTGSMPFDRAKWIELRRQPGFDKALRKCSRTVGFALHIHG
ncbi:hypothetical protein [Streptomyces sp. NPDC047009]|uniref:hypothetical protein n=1 Tax=unclassified Streptomyces TaxID=2593676 RepID=UPI0033DE4EC2